MSYWVYIHTCPNGKKYVGCTKQARPELRWKEGRGYYQNKHFYSAIRKYGWSSIKHEAWELTCESEMYYAEKYLIAYYNTADNKFGYNRSSGGEKSFLGCKHSEEVRKKIAEARKGKPLSEETRKHIAEAKKGKPHSEETRKKIAEAKKGKPHKPFSEEARKHISESLKGKIRSKETRKHMAEAAKNRPKVKIQLPDGTIVEITKQHLIKDYVNKNKAFQYVS